MGNIRYKGGNYTRDARSSYVVVEPLSVTSNGTYTAESGKAYNPVTVNVAPQESNDVNFYDYDGTVVHSYSKEQFLSLSEFPANPTHERLTSQGWNYSLADAKAYVTAYGVLNIGQMYKTASGALEIDIELHEGRLHPYLGLNINGSVTVDWGDGTATDTMTGSSLSIIVRKDHIYAAPGAYTIKIFAAEGTRVAIVGTNGYSNILTHSTSPSSGSQTQAYNSSVVKIYVANFVTSIGDNAFNACFSLTSITIPDSVTGIGYGAFSSCFSLISVTIPDGVTSINNITFITCRSLTSVTIPDTVTIISSNAFNECNSLDSITIPNSVTSIGNDTFRYCRSMTSITIPDSIASIGSNAFNTCASLISVTIPDGVTSIGSYAFSSCQSLGFIKFESQTPPTVSSSAWAYVPTDCIIYVPTGTIETYKATANMPNPSTYTYEEYTE